MQNVRLTAAWWYPFIFLVQADAAARWIMTI